MRLHQLTVTAFGPFAGTEEVDFDELNAAGLFLLTGPTGAGKTSLLDAICFALYGSVPGARGVKSLKSQHAGERVRPEVVLDFTVAERRFTIHRSPEWSRPKQRGSGFVLEPARAQLSERHGDELVAVSTRAQEIGHLVSGLMGMTAGQFQQVAMLPQGEFATFLQADSQQRHDVLQHLFRTDRFTRIEEWVAGHSKDLRGRSEAGQRQVRRLLDALVDLAEQPLPEALADEDLSTVPSLALLAWSEEVVAVAQTTVDASMTAEVDSAAALGAARTALDEARATALAIERREGARSAWAAADAAEDRAQVVRAALAADRAAAACAALIDLHDASEAELARSSVDGSIDGDDPGLDQADIRSQVQQARDRVLALRSLAPRVAERDAARRAEADARSEREEVRVALDRSRIELDLLPAEQQDLDHSRKAAAELAATAAAREDARARLRRRLEGAIDLAGERVALGEAEDAARAAVDRAQRERGRHLDLLHERIAGMAAELAGRLVEGEDCPVCGAVEHPRPATAQLALVDEETVSHAETAAQVAESDRHRAEQALGFARERVLRLESLVAGADVPSLTLAVAEADGAVAEAFAAAHAVTAAEARLLVLAEEQATLRGRVSDLETRLATLDAQITAAEEAGARATAVLAVEAPDLAVDGDLDTLVADESSRMARLQATEGSLLAHEALRLRVAEQRRNADEAAAAAGFGDLAQARASILDDETRDQHEVWLRDLDLERDAARRTLEDPAVARLADETPTPDLVSLLAQVEAAQRRHEESSRARTRLELTRDRVEDLRARLGQALTTWEPVRDESVRADSMARLVRGVGGDNHRQIRLSSYVLASRLDQVVAAANERLGEMRDHRYLLERSDRVHRRGSQSGLALQVVDEWTGEVRDPATLSGGETFFVSLSLALGLADVVTYEAGGTLIETLFVDEGFGSLDPETLDDVLDRLDTLREGGRSVGLVSHVSEMRNRVPTQLHVDKRRTGSSVSVHTSVA